MNSRRLLELDALRGLAALAVVFCHFTSVGHQLAIFPFEFRYGAYGPHLFFIISGFVIFMTLEKTRTAADFIVSRFSRLYPAYWVAVAVTFVAFSLFPRDDHPVSLPTALINLTMIQNWLRVPDLSVVYWTLAVEMKFYVVMLLVFLLGRLRQIEAVSIAWLVLIALYRATTTWAGLPPLALLKVPLTIDYAQLFIAGMMFYRLKTAAAVATTRGERLRQVARHAIIAACLLMQYVAAGLEATLIVAVLLAVFYLFLAGRAGWLAARPLVFLGTISYSLYLIHDAVGTVLLTQWSLLWNWPLTLMGLALAACLGISMAMTFGVEYPALGAIRSLYNRVRGRRTAVAAALERPTAG